MPHWYLIHGAASSRLTWTRQMRVLSSATRAELPALPDLPPDQLIDAWADWCLADLNQPAVLMGHSLGGAIAQTMALKAPTMVEGLVLVGTGPHLPVNPVLLTALQSEPEAALARITRWSLGRDPNPDLLARSLAQAAVVDHQNAYRQFLACTYFDVRARLQDITCPRAVIAGAEDRMTSAELTQQFVDAWPDVPYFVIPNAGHTMMLEQPEAFNEVLGELIDRFNW